MKYGHNSFDASFSSVWSRHGLESSLRLFSLQACHGAKKMIRPTTVPCCESLFPPRTSIQRFTGYHYNHNTKRMCVMVISERVSLLMRVCRSLDKARAGLSDLTSRLPNAFCQDNLLLVLYSADIRHMLGRQLSFLAIAKWVFESESKNRRYRH